MEFPSILDDITIREIQSSDNRKVASMIRSVFHDLEAQTEGTVYEDSETDHLFEFFQNQQNAVYFVAEKKDQIVGACGVYPTEGLPDDTVELVKYYVAKEVRGKGVGKALFIASENAAKEFDFKRLYLETTASFNAAAQLYKKIGFMSLDKPLGQTGHFGCTHWMLKSI